MLSCGRHQCQRCVRRSRRHTPPSHICKRAKRHTLQVSRCTFALPPTCSWLLRALNWCNTLPTRNPRSHQLNLSNVKQVSLILKIYGLGSFAPTCMYENWQKSPWFELQCRQIVTHAIALGHEPSQFHQFIHQYRYVNSCSWVMISLKDEGKNLCAKYFFNIQNNLFLTTCRRKHCAGKSAAACWIIDASQFLVGNTCYIYLLNSAVTREANTHSDSGINVSLF